MSTNGSNLIRVGVVGADPTGRGFGPRAHLPAIRACPDLELLAVCTSRPETARRAAEQWEAPRWYAGYEALMDDLEVDVITVAVRVRLHHEIVEAALEAGKAVYCEWPLGLDSKVASLLSDLADQKKTVNGVGTQGRFAPAIRRAKTLVKEGAIGVPIGFHVTQLLEPFEVQSDRWWFAKDEEASGALHVATAHVMDLVQHLLHPVSSIAGAIEIMRPEGTFSDTGEPFRWTAADTVSWITRLADGQIGSGLITNTALPSAGFALRVLGESGQLLIESNGYAQFRPMRLFIGHVGASDLSPLDLGLDATYPPDLTEENPGFNVCRALTDFAASYRRRSRFRPDFSDAVQLHRVIEAIASSSEDGRWHDMLSPYEATG